MKRLQSGDLTTLTPGLRQKLKIGDFVCNSCNSRKCGSQTAANVPSASTELPSTFRISSKMQDASASGNANMTINLGIPKSSSSSAICFVCQKDKRKRSSKSGALIKLSPSSRAKIFVMTGIYVPENARSCSSHFVHGEVSSDCYDTIRCVSDTISAGNAEIVELLTEVRTLAMQDKHRLNFDDPRIMSDEDYFRLTGLNKAQFDTLVSKCTSIRSTSNRSNITALALLMMKLRTVLSVALLSTLFGLSKRCCARAIHSARQGLMEKIVPDYIGLGHIDRETVIKDRTTAYAKALFGNDQNDTAIAVADGTYIYIEKSGNYSFQRRSYSMHKGRPLVKHMTLVATDGYILSVLGPFLADGKNNDANITKSLFESNTENITEWFEDDDVLVVDRGFRDVIDLLSDKGIQTEMPHFLQKTEKQHSTEEANESRLVTKVRWVVESANGQIKQWKALSNDMPNTQIPFTRVYQKIRGLLL